MIETDRLRLSLHQMMDFHDLCAGHEASCRLAGNCEYSLKEKVHFRGEQTLLLQREREDW